MQSPTARFCAKTALDPRNNNDRLQALNIDLSFLRTVGGVRFDEPKSFTIWMPRVSPAPWVTCMRMLKTPSKA